MTEEERSADCERCCGKFMTLIFQLKDENHGFSCISLLLDVIIQHVVAFIPV
jgi:hypothetical protein